ncbi:MAG: helix-turn-helix domain-containing protein [Desulfobacterales bacterium]|nr:helix-turn-helix domain-containing protein [Desulfobacterales bacterium]
MEKRKAKLKARKRQVALAHCVMAKRLASALETLCLPILPEYVNDENGIDLTGREIVFRMGFMAWNIAVTGQMDLAFQAFGKTNLSEEEQMVVRKEIIGLVRQKYAEYPDFRTAMRDFSVSWANNTMRIKVRPGETYPKLPKIDFSDSPEPQEPAPASILSLRKSMKLTQVKFAGLLGVSVKRLSAWEHGKAEPSAPEKEKIRSLQETHHEQA